MFFRRSAWILFVLALLSQLGAPFAHAGSNELAEKIGAYCAALHETAGGMDAPGSASDHQKHSHALCGVCPCSVGAAPIASLPLSIRYDGEIHELAGPFVTEASISRGILKLGAAPRAPPASV